MTTAVYIASAEGGEGKSTLALGLVEAFAANSKNVGVFRPLVKSAEDDIVTRTLVAQESVPQSYGDAIGVSYSELLEDPDKAMNTIVTRFDRLREKYDAVVVVGSDYKDVSAPIEMNFNARVAANLNAPVLLVVRGRGRSVEQVKLAAQVAIREFRRSHNTVFGLVATRVEPDRADEVRIALSGLNEDVITGVIPETSSLAAPTIGTQIESLGADLLMGSTRELGKESLGVMVAGMTLPNLLGKLQEDFTVLMPADRADLLPGLVMAHRSGQYPELAGIILTGGYEVHPGLRNLIDALDSRLPIAVTPHTTMETAERLARLEGTRTDSPRKVQLSRKLFNDNINAAQLLDSLQRHPSTLRTPISFENELTARARRDLRTIVLPESSDDRILRSAAIVLAKQTARLVLLGDSLAINTRARELGIDLSRATIVDPTDDALLNRFATEYARLRAKKGVTFEQAKERMADLSYFGTMMVHFGMADGMVSGAVNTTANTIRPSLEFIKTKPGVSAVSGAFLMCMPDEVVVYADCAVNPNPTPEQLAGIAISSAETAEGFGIEPRVAMISYSTGESGSGPDVDAVREATRLAKEQSPELKVEGPIQFDAAVDPVVAAKKLPGSEVAGRASVLIFPDLNTGNATYKAVQRTSGALAVGPVLQGLNCPVNDLSRGALVDDIVNTIAITAIQAQARPAGSGSPLRDQGE